MATIGGILLMIGAVFTFRGQIMYAVITYFFADIMWIILAYQHNDMQGMSFIIVGTLLGVGAFIKMNIGTMRKSLSW